MTRPFDSGEREPQLKATREKNAAERTDDARLHRGIRAGGAGNAAHQRTHQDIDLREPAVHPAGQQLCKRKQPLGDAAVVHQVACEDEKGDCQ